MIKILVVDDQLLLVKLLERQLSTYADLIVAGTAQDGCQAVEMAKHLMPDVILMDIRMPDCDGIEAVRRLKELSPNCRVLMLSDSLEEQDVHGAVAAGADGYLLKSVDAEELIMAIRSVYAGYEVFHPAIKKAAKRTANLASADDAGSRVIIVNNVRVVLSPRELDVIQWITDGLSTKEMAKRLFVSEGRLRNILTEIIGKLMVKDRTQVAVFAIKHNLVQLRAENQEE